MWVETIIFIYLGHNLAFSHIPHNTEGYILEFSVPNCPELANIIKVAFIGLQPLKASGGVSAGPNSSDKLQGQQWLWDHTFSDACFVSFSLLEKVHWKSWTAFGAFNLPDSVRRLSETVNRATERALLYSLELLLIKWKFDHFMFVIVCVFLLLEQGHK